MKGSKTKAEFLKAITTVRKECDALIADIPHQRLSEPVTSGNGLSKFH